MTATMTICSLFYGQQLLLGELPGSLLQALGLHGRGQSNSFPHQNHARLWVQPGEEKEKAR